MGTLTSIVDLANKRPRAFVKVSLGVGQRASGAAPITCLLIGNKTTAAPTDPITNDTMEQVFDEQEVIDKTGAGSELHRMWRAASKSNKNITAWIGAIAESAGTAASYTTTIAGTATAASTIEVSVAGDTPLQIAIANGDLAATVRANIIAAINGVAHTPVIATESTNDVVVTAKSKGPRGNYIRFRTRWLGGTTGAGLTVTTIQPSGVYLASGTTSDDPTNLIAAIGTQRFHLFAAPYSRTAEATEIDLLIDHVEAQADPLVSKRGRIIFGNQEALATAVTLATGATFNRERSQIMWTFQDNSEPCVMAASMLGRMSAELGRDRASNTDGAVLDALTPQWVEADKSTEAEITSALNSGLTPLQVVGSDVQVARSITAKSRDASGNPDYTTLDTHYVDVADYIGDLLEDNFATAFAKFKIGKDIAGEMPPPGVATPNTVKAWALNLVAPEDNKTIVNFDSVTAAGAVFEENETAAGRIDGVLPIDVIELFHQFAVDVRQVG
jgi:phage tail sheath gpL-like